MAAVTRLGPEGFSRIPYGSFTGKSPQTATKTYVKTFTRLGLEGYSAIPYGGFSVKVAAATRPNYRGFLVNVGRGMR